MSEKLVEDPKSLGWFGVITGILFLLATFTDFASSVVNIAYSFGGCLLITGVVNLIKVYKPDLYKKIYKILTKKNPN